MKLKLSLLAFSFATLISNTVFANPQVQNSEGKNQVIIENNSENYILNNSNFEKSIPKELQVWKEYIKQKNPSLFCPQNNLETNCIFFSALKLEELNNEFMVTIKGASFIEGFISIPQFKKIYNDEKVWYKKVTVNNSVGEIISKNEENYVKVTKGDFEIKLHLDKKSFNDIDSIVFKKSPLVLINNIKNKTFIKEGNVVKHFNNETFKEDIKNKNETDNVQQEPILNVEVYRKLTTDIPNLLETEIKIIYSGNKKDYFLGKVIPKDFEFNSAISELSIEKREDGFWAKLIPGEYNIKISSFSLKNIEKINIKDLVLNSNFETWSLEQKSDVRKVTIIADKSVDPKLNPIPEYWKNLPAYTVSNEMSIVNDKFNQDLKIKTKINRVSYFGFNNDTMNHVDILNISNQDKQLINQINNDFIWENFLLKNEYQPLVSLQKESSAFIPKGDFIAKVQSSTNNKEINYQFLSGETTIEKWILKLAPRYRVLGITGDSVSSENTWLDNWNLYKIFSVFLIVLVFFKLFGLTTSVLSFLGIILFQGEIFSWTLWLSLLLILGILKVIPKENIGDFRKNVSYFGLFLIFIFGIQAIIFMFNEVHLIINPSLEYMSNISNNTNYINFIFPILAIYIIFKIIYSIINKKENEKNSEKKKNWIFYIVGLFVIFAIFNYEDSKKDNVKRESSLQVFQMNDNSSGGGLEMKNVEEIITATPSSLSVSPTLMDKSVKYKKEEINNQLINQKINVGSGEIIDNNYNYPNYVTVTSNKKIKESSKVNFWIAPIWLVNIFSIIQIVFLFNSLLLFSIGVLYLSNDDKWFDKLPIKLKNNRFIKFILFNDFKKGF